MRENGPLTHCEHVICVFLQDTGNTHFYSFELVKTGEAPENIKKFGLQLRACVYKKR